MKQQVKRHVGAALVTHNSERWLPQTLASIDKQSVPVDQVCIVDDASSDGTLDILEGWSRDRSSHGTDVQVVAATSTDSDALTRTARNFTQAVRALSDCDLVALADHDDVWIPDRIQVQRDRMLQHPSALVLASNGVIAGSTSQTTLFDTFHVPVDLGECSCREIARFVVRRSVATGSAAMLRPGLLTDLHLFTPPSGWLHDRWWSILAASRCGLLVDPTPVIEYRLSHNQQVGLDRGRQATRSATRLRSLHDGDGGKFLDLMRVKRDAHPDVANSFSPIALAINLGRN